MGDDIGFRRIAVAATVVFRLIGDDDKQFLFAGRCIGHLDQSIISAGLICAQDGEVAIIIGAGELDLHLGHRAADIEFQIDIPWQGADPVDVHIDEFVGRAADDIQIAELRLGQQRCRAGGIGEIEIFVAAVLRHGRKGVFLCGELVGNSLSGPDRCPQVLHEKTGPRRLCRGPVQVISTGLRSDQIGSVIRRR